MNEVKKIFIPHYYGHSAWLEYVANEEGVFWHRTDKLTPSDNWQFCKLIAPLFAPLVISEFEKVTEGIYEFNALLLRYGQMGLKYLDYSRSITKKIL